MNSKPLPCQQVEVLINRFVDHELTDNDRVGLETHLDGCPSCLRAFRMTVEIEGVFDASLNTMAPVRSGMAKSSGMRKIVSTTRSASRQEALPTGSKTGRVWLSFAVAAVVFGVLLWNGEVFQFGENSDRQNEIARISVVESSSEEDLYSTRTRSLLDEKWIAAERFRPVGSGMKISDMRLNVNENKFPGERFEASPSKTLSVLQAYQVVEKVERDDGFGMARSSARPVYGMEERETPERPESRNIADVWGMEEPQLLSNQKESVERPEIPDRPDRPDRLALDLRKEAPEFTVAVRSVSRTDRPEKPQRPKRQNRPDRPDRPDRPERKERPNRPDRPERGGKPERPEKAERPEKPERPEVPDIERPDKPEIEDLPERPDAPEKPDLEDRPEKVEILGASEVERPEHPELSDRPEKPEVEETPELPERPGKAGRPHRGSRK